MRTLVLILIALPALAQNITRRLTMRIAFLVFVLCLTASAQTYIFGGGKAAAIVGPRGSTLPASCTTPGLMFTLLADDGTNKQGDYRCVNGYYTRAGLTGTEGRLLRFGAANAVGLTTGLYEDGSGNVGIRTAAPTAKLDVNGNALIYDSTATTGATTVTIKAGAGQSTTDLLALKNSSGSLIGRILSSGAMQLNGGFFVGGGNGGAQLGYYNNTLTLGSAWPVTWSSTAAANGTSDLALSRASAGVLEVNSGTALALRDLNLRTISGGWRAEAEGGCNTYTDLAVDGALNTKVTSASYNFVAADVGSWIDVTAGSGWTTGRYVIVSVASNAATLSSSPAAVSTTGGTYITGRGKIVHVAGGTDVADTLRFCGKGADNAMAWRALY